MAQTAAGPPDVHPSSIRSRLVEGGALGLRGSLPTASIAAASIECDHSLTTPALWPPHELPTSSVRPGMSEDALDWVSLSVVHGYHLRMITPSPRTGTGTGGLSFNGFWDAYDSNRFQVKRLLGIFLLCSESYPERQMCHQA